MSSTMLSPLFSNGTPFPSLKVETSRSLILSQPTSLPRSFVVTFTLLRCSFLPQLDTTCPPCVSVVVSPPLSSYSFPLSRDSIFLDLDPCYRSISVSPQFTGSIHSLFTFPSLSLLLRFAALDVFCLLWVWFRREKT
ncbi:hypothetical protein FRC14_003304 [Serendipita sp. 396]|nr:hypothetical protein FRC14_003304 [Serendipita sp. 396]